MKQEEKELLLKDLCERMGGSNTNNKDIVNSVNLSHKKHFDYSGLIY